MEHSRAIYFIFISFFHNSFLSSETDALPVTSKPIENSVENLAWQAWLMLPTEQKNLEKTRKVTPKSIFTLPLRDCPIGYKQIETACKNNCAPSQMSQIRCVSTCPNGYKEENLKCVLDCPSGHKVFDFRCISLFDIDQENLLAQELGLLVGNMENSYDYEDEEILAYDNSQKFSNDGISMGYNFESETQLPTKDEPLKFNIFEQKYPTDYTEYGVDSTANKQTNHNLNKQIGTSLVDSKEQPIAKNQDEAFSKNNDPPFMNITALPTRNTLSPEEYYSLGSVDASALPASAIDISDRVSLFKTENLMQAISSPLNKSKNYQDLIESNTDLADLMLIDDLLPVNTTSFGSSVWQPSDSKIIANKSVSNAESGEISTTLLDTEDSVTLTPNTYVNKISSTFGLKSNFSESNTREMFQGTRDLNNENHVNSTNSNSHNFGSTLGIEKREEIYGPIMGENSNTVLINISDKDEHFDPQYSSFSLTSHLIDTPNLNELQSESSIGNEAINNEKILLNVSKPIHDINQADGSERQLQVINTLVKDKRNLDSIYVFPASLNNLSISQYENNISKSSLSDEKRNSNTVLVNLTSLGVNTSSRINASMNINVDVNIPESSKFTSPMSLPISTLRSSINKNSSNESSLDSSSTEASKQVALNLNLTESEKPIQYSIYQSTTTKSVQDLLNLKKKANSTRNFPLQTVGNNMTETSRHTFEPFWWLPIGWSLDRKSNLNKYPQINNQNRTSQSLVFGLWSHTTSITSQNTQKKEKSFIDENAS